MKAIIIYAAFVFIACFIAYFIGEKIRHYNNSECDFMSCETCKHRYMCNGEIDEWDEQ